MEERLTINGHANVNTLLVPACFAHVAGLCTYLARSTSRTSVTSWLSFLDHTPEESLCKGQEKCTDI